jgi:hypothetical protein
MFANEGNGIAGTGGSMNPICCDSVLSKISGPSPSPAGENVGANLGRWLGFAWSVAAICLVLAAGIAVPAYSAPLDDAIERYRGYLCRR